MSINELLAEAQAAEARAASGRPDSAAGQRRRATAARRWKSVSLAAAEYSDLAWRRSEHLLCDYSQRLSKMASLYERDDCAELLKEAWQHEGAASLKERNSRRKLAGRELVKASKAWQGLAFAALRRSRAFDAALDKFLSGI